MSDKHTKQNNEGNGGNKMVLRSIYFELPLWNAAMAKAKRNRVPLAVIVRQLLKAWLKGEISIQIDDNEN